MAKVARAVQTAQATVVRTSGLERASALLDVSSKELRSAVKETARYAEDASGQATSNKTPVATAAPTTAPTNT